MVVTEIMTVLLVILKLTGCIRWSWWLVLLPEILAVILYIVIIISVIVANVRTKRAIEEMFRKGR